MGKRVRKLRKARVIFLLIVLFVILFYLVNIFYVNNVVYIDIVDITQSNDEIIIELDKDAKCSIDDKNYIDSKNKICKFDFVEELKILYLKNENNKVTKYYLDKQFLLIENFNVKDKDIYLATNDAHKIDYDIKYKGYLNKQPTFKSSDTKVATVTTDGKITGISDGKATITVSFNNIDKKIRLTVTSLITKKTSEFNYDKPYLSCNLFTEEDNDLLDKILENRVNTAGYQTRAGAVEAARFITLEFPYRINYFSENGRLNAVDGEGRYYHKGLYLDESRFSTIGNSKHGPNPWGCDIYSDPAGGVRKNGLDCSGFITWVLYQGGFDPGDISAGVNNSVKDLTDLGQKEKMTEAIDKIKVGDLLSGDGETTNAYMGGHIAMLIGIKNGNYYVAEELWGKPSPSHSAVAQKYTKEEFLYYFYWRIDMSEFYKKDGNLTNYWL